VRLSRSPYQRSDEIDGLMEGGRPNWVHDREELELSLLGRD
jgi:hypothetical protein